MIIKVRKINSEIMWGDMIGIEYLLNGKNVFLYEWIKDFQKLKISIDVNGDGRNKITEHITLALGEDRFLETLKNNYGIEIEFVEAFDFSEESKLKAQGLIQAGFQKIVLQNGQYMVDNLFAQQFLKEEEAEFLLSKEVEELLLSEI